MYQIDQSLLDRQKVSSKFQSADRDIEISFSATVATSMLYIKNDFVGPVGSFDIHFWSGAPLEIKDYLTIFKPFDPYVWGFLIASLMAVSAALIFINKMHATWSQEFIKESPFQSKEKLGG